MKESKSHQVFRARVDYLSQHHEVVAAALAVSDGAVKAADVADPAAFATSTLSCVLAGATSTAYPRLARLPARQWGRSFRAYSERLNGEYTLHLLYGHFEEYVYAIRASLPEVVGKYPGAVWEDVVVPADKVRLAAATPAAIDQLLGAVQKENLIALRSGREVCDRLIKVCALKIDSSKRDKAILVLDVRNCIVHNGGRISKAMVTRNRGLVKSILGMEAEDVVRLDAQLVRQMLAFVGEHVADVDGALIAQGIIPCRAEPRRRRKPPGGSPPQPATGTREAGRR